MIQRAIRFKNTFQTTLAVLIVGCSFTASEAAWAQVEAITGAIMAIGASEVAQGQSKGANFDEKLVERIRKGKTREADLIKMFGEPDQRGMTGDGKTLMWQRQDMKADATSGALSLLSFKPSIKMKMLMVMLNQKGIVKDFTFNTSGN